MSELKVLAWLFASRKSLISRVWAAPGGRDTLQKGGGASPPTFLEGFPAARGRPDHPKSTISGRSKNNILGVWAAPGGRETLQKGGGRSPPTFLEGFPAARGRPDPQNRRFPVGQKITPAKHLNSNSLKHGYGSGYGSYMSRRLHPCVDPIRYELYMSYI